MTSAPLSEALRRRSEQHREPTFDRLVRAARELFTRDGYAASSLDAVAAASGVTKGSLYHHFTRKTELFEAVFEEEASELCDRVAREIAGKRDPWRGAFAGIRAFLHASQEPSVLRIMFLDAPSVLGWERVREIEANYGLALIKTALEQLRAGGEIERHDIDTLAHLFLGALSEGALLIARAQDKERTRRAVERELRRLLQGLAVTPD